MIGVCKFCGCTDETACQIPFDADGNILRDSISIMYSPNLTPCAWLLEDVCTNPDCALKAYLEARPLAESLMHALEMLEAA